MSKSLYEKIGGEPAIHAAVEIFYKKVLADKRISYFFDHIDMKRQAEKQRAFLTFALGGTRQYNGRNMKAAHTKAVKEGLSDVHFDAVLENLALTLKELEVPEELIQEAAQIVETTREDVLGRSPVKKPSLPKREDYEHV
jgi:hemoglobin